MKLRFAILILLFPHFYSCIGQSNQPGKLGNSELLKTPIAASKLVKNHFSNQVQAMADNIHCMMEDKAGNLWFGTTGDGVYKYDGKQFVNYTTKQGLKSNAIWSLLEDQKGNILIGTDAGLSMFNGKVISPVSLEGSLGFDTNEYGSSKNAIWSMLLDSKGKIWLGTGDAVFWSDGKSFTRFLKQGQILNPQSLKLKMVDDLYEDKYGVIWFASGMPPGLEGVCRYDGKSITSVKPNGDSWIRYIVPDKKGWIWFGGRLNGNFYFDGKAFNSFNLRTDIGNVMLCDAAGNLWFCGSEANKTYENKDGIWRYDGKNFVNFSTAEGMGKEFVHSMLQDKKGNIWIGTRNTGLYRYDGKKITRFSE
jgi:ligand-binding sensor domain-containing protein